MEACMSTDQYIHEQILGLCWHEWSYKTWSTLAGNGVYYQCGKCPATSDDGRDNPAYSSPDSPRSPLDAVEQKAITEFGDLKYGTALLDALDLENLCDNPNIGNDYATIIATSPADVRVRALRSLWESKK